jgi:DNA-binding NtrC family response regulator
MDRVIKVLLAEDEEIYSAPIQIALSDAGFQVISAIDVEQLFAAAQEADVLVVDVRLPQKNEPPGAFPPPNGIKAVGTLIDQGKVSETTPIILCSAYVESEYVSKDPTLSQGRYVWLSKPFATDALIEIIRRELSSRRQ